MFKYFNQTFLKMLITGKRNHIYELSENLNPFWLQQFTFFQHLLFLQLFINSQTFSLQHHMKIFIARLNGNTLTQFITQDSEKQSGQNSGSQITSSSSIISYEQSKKLKQKHQKQTEIEEYNKRTLILQIIDHSRKLPLSQYDNQLNYVRIRGEEFFYLARHKLLFIYTSPKDQYTLLAIQNILNNCVRSFQCLFQNICTGKKLPNHLTDYQAQEFRKLRFRIEQIIAEEDHFQLKRRQSFKQPKSQSSLLSISQRGESFKSISEKQLKRKQEQINYIYQTQKKLMSYRLKLFILFILGITVTLTSLYFLLRENKANTF